jgi:aspartokinase
MEPAEEAGIEVSVRNSFAPDRIGTRVTGFESGSGVRCVALRGKVPVEIPCTNGRPSEAAMVVCIGEPNAADLKHGLKVLRGAKIAPLHSGLASAGLVYLVNSEAGEAALRVLHDSLVTVAPTVEVA